MIPIWLLDIDGVINAGSRDPDRSVWPEDQWIRASARDKGRDWPLLAALPVLDFLREVHTLGRAEIRWHTSWQHGAVNAAAALDLPAWPVVPCPEFDDRPAFVARALRDQQVAWWKLPAVERLIQAEQRPIIWTDDHIAAHLQRRHDMYDVTSRLLVHAPAMLVAPSFFTGLTPKHLRQIGDFLDIHAPAGVTR
jgi:hypothetical protein